MTIKWIAEPVEYQYIRPNGVFYLLNPLDFTGLGNRPHYCGEDFEPDRIVWTLYEGWRGKNPWVVKEYTASIEGGNNAAGLINDFYTSGNNVR